MLLISRANLVYLAVPKTGTTSVETALRPMADMVLGGKRKHVNARRYRAKIAPFLADVFGVRPETVAVMRAPLEQVESWYRYRAREALEGHPNSTSGIAFDDFVAAVVSEDPPPFAAIGSQGRFLTGRDGALAVDHLFSYAEWPRFAAFLSDRLGQPLDLQRKNVPPPGAVALSAATEAAFRAARADELALYDRLSAAGGYLGPGT